LQMTFVFLLMIGKGHGPICFNPFLFPL